MKENKSTKKMDIIQDTSAGDLILDLNAEDPDVDSNGIIETNISKYRKNDSIVFSMRMEASLLEGVRQIARERSAKEKKNISYQKLIEEAVREKYFENEI